MKNPSVAFYKKLILISIALLILLPVSASIYLLIENRSLKARQVFANNQPDDVVTVSATQLEPNNVVKDKPVLSYQMLYPDFRSDFFGFKNDLVSNKTVFITFDDGPSSGTSKVLDILRKESVPATFFVNGKSNPFLTAQLSKIVSEGHTLGMHSYTHRYNVIYASMENFLDDFKRNFLYIKNATGAAPQILRFPGGSINIFNIGTYQSLIAEMLRRGFIYYDWNVSAGDAIPGATTQSIIDNVLHGVHLCWGPAFVLFHDNGSANLNEALPVILETLKREGYEFKRIDNSVKPPMFIYPD